MLTVFGFPGQGSQFRGMGGDLFSEFPNYVRRADAVLGYSIEDLCLNDTGNRLSSTVYAQPALFLVNALTFLKRRSCGHYQADIYLGHSLGEYSALFAAGVFDFETGLRIVQKRGELMGRARSGSMAAIIGLDAASIRQVLDNFGLHGIDMANYNTPNQTVVAGSLDSLTDAERAMEQAGATFVPLNVSAAFHSRFMQFMAEEFAEFLGSYAFRSPDRPVIANVDARPYCDDDIAGKLVDQISNPVRWVDSIDYVLAEEPITFEEIGPGQVLTGMVTTITEQRV